MTLTTIILLVLTLYMLQIFLQETSRFGFDVRGIVGNRDNPPEMTVMAGRLDRAKNNMQEALPMFLGLALLALATGRDTSPVTDAALVFLIARVAYARIKGVRALKMLRMTFEVVF
jgi:uncharacterized MAPEG superfamily protein